MTLTAINAAGQVVDGRLLLDPRQRSDFDQLKCPISGELVFPVRAYARSDRDSITSAHFRHRRRVTEIQWPSDLEPDIEYGRDGFLIQESPLHLEAKRFVASHLEEEVANLAGAQVLVEHRIEIEPGRFRIADVALLSRGRVLEVHECQASLLPLETIAARNDDYASLGIACYWWVAGAAADAAEVRRVLRESCGGFFELVVDPNDRLREPSRAQPAPAASARGKRKA
jgi:hypothetical protein